MHATAIYAFLMSLPVVIVIVCMSYPLGRGIVYDPVMSFPFTSFIAPTIDDLSVVSRLPLSPMIVSVIKST